MTFKKGDRVESLITGAQYTVVHYDIEGDRVWIRSDTGDNILIVADIFKKCQRPIEVGDTIIAESYHSLHDAQWAYKVVYIHQDHVLVEIVKSPYSDYEKALRLLEKSGLKAV